MYLRKVATALQEGAFRGLYLPEVVLEASTSDRQTAARQNASFLFDACPSVTLHIAFSSVFVPKASQLLWLAAWRRMDLWTLVCTAAKEQVEGADR